MISLFHYIKLFYYYSILLVAAPERPVPKRAPPRPKSYPQAEALYDYTASDTDEISLSAGEKLFVLKEGKFTLSANINIRILRYISQKNLLPSQYYI